jgi:hypothetical protein
LIHYIWREGKEDNIFFDHGMPKKAMVSPVEHMVYPALHGDNVAALKRKMNAKVGTLETIRLERTYSKRSTSCN